MRCLKCKKEIADDILRCNFCNTKVRTVCPVCGAKNPINAEYCEKCGLQLLKYCPSCHSVNLPNADICRKCSTPFYKAEGEISIADLENQLNESSSIKEEQPVNVGQNADNEIQVQLKQNDLSDVDITKETSNVIEAEKHETDEINTNESDDVDLADIGEEDFELQELQEDELLDFSEGENIDDISEHNVNNDILTNITEPLRLSDESINNLDIVNSQDTADLTEQTLVDIENTELNEPVKTEPMLTIDIKSQNQSAPDSELLNFSDNKTECVEESEMDLFSLVDDTDKLKEGLKKENIEPEKIINVNAADDYEKKNQAGESENSLNESAVISEDKTFEKTEANNDKTEKADAVKEKSVELQPNKEVKKEENIKPHETNEENTANEVKYYNQMKSKNLIVESVRNPQKLIIGLSAPEGYGKSTVLKYLFSDLMHQNYVWLWGECSANSQISPYGIFQEMILTFFNMPNFSNMSQDFYKQAKAMLAQSLPFLDSEEIFNLFNFLYPTLTANFEDILVNRDTTFALLEKLIVEISKKSKLIIVIDDFDMIDGASYAFLTYFVEQEHLNDNIKIIISYKDNRITQGYFYSEKLKQNQYEDIRLDKLSPIDANNLVKMFLNGTNPLPEEMFERIYSNSQGNSAYIEQAIVLFNETGAFVTENNTVTYKKTPLELKFPQNIYEIFTLRLNHLKTKFPLAYKTLCTAAIMGNKFNIRLLEIVMKYNPEDFQNIVQMLMSFAYISQFNTNIYEFKNTLLWRFVYEKAKSGDDFVLLNEKIFDIINSFTLSSNALKALIAQSLNQKLLALNIWTENIKLCAYLGDEHLWTLSQKQCLKIAQEINPENNTVIINNIQERLGKLLYISRPQEAIPLLSAAISNALKVGNQPKIIELSGYLSKSCSLTGNYNGVIEAVDTVLKIIDTSFNKLETALVKYKKLKAMFSIGNAEEIYNIASNEIIPIVEQALSGLIPNNGISMDIIYETWLECNLTVAMALISQGSVKCFDILKVIDEIVCKNNVDNKNYLQRFKLAKALAFSIHGDIKESEDILLSLSQQTVKDNVEPQIISMWNFINILNKLYRQEWQNIKEDLYSVVTFANNYNDVLVKNLLKVFLGKILQEEGDMKKAFEIYNEQVAVFAKEKIAIGALLCWYYIAKLTLVTEGSDKALIIAQKALEVAKNPKISNYYFIVLYKKLISEIYLIKGDTEAAKMYIEKALMIAKQNDIKLLKISLYLLYAKYLEEMVNSQKQNKANYAQNAINTYKKSLTLAQDMDIPVITAEINKNYASFKAFCQLNGIKL